MNTTNIISEIINNLGFIGTGGLVGMLITILANHYLQKDRTLDHRTYELKKEIYLDVFEVFDRQHFKTIEYLKKIISEDINKDPETHILEYADKIANKLSRVKLVCSKELEELVDEFPIAIISLGYKLNKHLFKKQGGIPIDEDLKHIHSIQTKIIAIIKLELNLLEK